ncbi:phosphatase PAP2 family protein [soil metagenome]
MKKSNKSTKHEFRDDKKEVLKKVSSHEDNIPVVSKTKFDARKTLFYIILGSVIAGFGLLTFYVRQKPYFALDLKITKEIQEFNPTWFETLMNIITFIGNPLNSGILTALVVGVLFYKKRTKESIMLLAAVAGSTILTQIIKAIVHRPRPTPHLIHQIGKYLSNDSFPSGHVMFYIMFFGFLWFLTFTLPKENKYRTFLLWLFPIMILLIGPSRIYVGAHWFSDVMGAYLLGFVCLIVTTNIYSRWQKRPNAS